MARILRDYKCAKHGFFEAWTAPEKTTCPMKGCSESVMLVYLQPPGMKSDRTKKTDATLRGLAKDFGMTDIKSTREGEHQTGYLKRNNSQTDKERQAELEAAAHHAPRNNAMWGGQGGINFNSVVGGQFKPVAGEAVSVLPQSVGNFTGPRAASYVPDHESLTVQK